MMFFRCELWAQFMFPDKEFSSVALQTKLFTEHRMLCQNHFRNEDFTDASKTKLISTAVPSQVKLYIPINEPQPGPSNRLALRDVTNVEESSTVPSQNVPALFISLNEPQPGPSNRLASKEIPTFVEASTV
ncbi:hypothetical protein ACJJTC_008994 [Scirpophaga incertulas]